MFNNSTSLKDKLTEIKKNDFSVPDGVDPYEMALDMMREIGSIDPELRDELIYSTFATWTMKGVFTDAQVEELLDISMGEDYLFYEVGEFNKDTVFKRAFCCLTVAVLIYRHREKGIIPDEKLKAVADRFIDYYSREKDVRGYVDVKGWAHSAAHGADALDEFAQCKAITYEQLLHILNVIRDKVCIRYYTYINQEDERMTTAVVSALDRNKLEEHVIIDWIKGFKDAPLDRVHPEYHAVITNIKSFLRSLYFRLLEDSCRKNIADAIRETLKLIK